MKQAIYLMLLLVGWLPTTALAQNADEILKQAAEMYAQSNGIQAHFSLHTTIPQQGVSESFEGIIYMHDDQFKLETPDMTTWYDGTTQWTYLPRTEEVNITTPSGISFFRLPSGAWGSGTGLPIQINTLVLPNS